MFVPFHKEVLDKMTFERIVDLLLFVEDNWGVLKNSPTLSTLKQLREVVRTCCKCVRSEQLQKLQDFYLSMGEKLTQDEKNLILSVSGGKFILREGGRTFLEIDES